MKNLHFKYEARPSLVAKKMALPKKLNPNTEERQPLFESEEMDLIYDPEEGLLIAVDAENLEEGLAKTVEVLNNFKLPIVTDEHFLIRTRQWGFFSMKDQAALENKGFIKDGEEWVFEGLN